MPDVLPTINNEPAQGIQALLDTVYLWNQDVANELIEQINELLEELGDFSDAGCIKPYNELVAPVRQYLPCYNGDNVYVAAADIETLPEQFNPSQWILIATKAPVLQAGAGIDINGNEISVEQQVLSDAAAGGTAVQPEDLGTAAYAATTDFATAAQGALADTAIQSVKTINGNTITGSGNLVITTFTTYPAGWPTTGTTKAFCDAIAADTSATEGMAYLGEVTLSDLPGGIVNSEIKVEIMSGTTAANKVILLTLTSGNVSPYQWQYTYWNNGSNVSGWIATGAQVNADWTSNSGPSQILHKPAIPDVVDNYNSTSANSALSANMGHDLNERLTSVEGRGRFLSTWNCATGLAGTNPPTSPYTYKSGDYFIVSQVGATNYRPSGAQYVTGTASSTVETGVVAVNDTYQYDGTNWVLLRNTVDDPLPSQTGNSGKFLTTNGTAASWGDALVNTATDATSLSIFGSLSNYAGAVALGPSTIVYSHYGTAIGSSAEAMYKGTAVGYNTGANANFATVIGYSAVATAQYAIQIGVGNSGTGHTNSDANTFKVGNANGNFEMMSADGTIPTDRFTTTPVADGAYVPTLTISSGTATRSWAPPADPLPSQSGQSGKYLTTNGTTASWATVDSLPSQTGHSGEFLTTNGTAASWSDKPLVNTATGTDGLTILGTASTVNYSTNIGVNSKVSQTSGVAIGRGSEARAYQSSKLGTAIGTNAFVEGEVGVAIGANSCSYANSSGYAVAIGGFANAYDYGIAIGTRTQVFNTAPGAIQLGNCWTNNTSPTQNMDAHTFKVGLRTGTNYELLSSDGTIPTARLTNAINKYSSMPTAGADYLGQIAQFTGTTDANYTHGYIYECVSDGGNPATYSWTAVSVQAGGSSLPSQTGNAGKLLTTDGTDASWDSKANLGLSGVTFRTWGANE